MHLNIFLYNETNRRTSFQIYSRTKHVDFLTRINLEVSASVSFIVKEDTLILGFDAVTLGG